MSEEPLIVRGYVVTGPNNTYMMEGPVDRSDKSSVHSVEWGKNERPEDATVFTEAELREVFGRNKEAWLGFEVDAIPATYQEGVGVRLVDGPKRDWLSFLEPSDKK